MIFLNSCQKKKISDNFTLLPTVKNLQYNGKLSVLNCNSEFNYYSESNELPVLLSETLKLKKGTANKHNFSFEIDSELDIADEGYHLHISKENIKIKAKDKAGLFYSFISLNQLITDSKDQNINLPIVSIKDFPSLKYRSIHIDVKHHTEKKEYYFELIDELASLKVNGIIIEFEDKLGYQKRPIVAAPDSYSISWWKSLSDYADKRNELLTLRRPSY